MYAATAGKMQHTNAWKRDSTSRTRRQGQAPSRPERAGQAGGSTSPRTALVHSCAVMNEQRSQLASGQRRRRRKSERGSAPFLTESEVLLLPYLLRHIFVRHTYRKQRCSQLQKRMASGSPMIMQDNSSGTAAFPPVRWTEVQCAQSPRTDASHPTSPAPQIGAQHRTEQLTEEPPVQPILPDPSFIHPSPQGSTRLYYIE